MSLFNWIIVLLVMYSSWGIGLISVFTVEFVVLKLVLLVVDEFLLELFEVVLLLFVGVTIVVELLLVVFLVAELLFVVELLFVIFLIVVDEELFMLLSLEVVWDVSLWGLASEGTFKKLIWLF